MTTINLLVTPLELLLIPMFAMAGHALKFYLFSMFGQPPDDAPLNISHLMSSLKQDAWQGVQEFSGILFAAVVAWSLFMPLATLALYHALRPCVAKMVVKFKSGD